MKLLLDWISDKRVAVWSIGILAVLLYANTLTHDFTLDDSIVITENIFTRKGIAGIGEIFSSDSFAGFFKTDSKPDLVSGGRYRPLSIALFAIIYELFGENPLLFHVVSIITYASCCVLVYLFSLKLFQTISTKRKKNKYVQIAALLTTLIFTSHPVHTEAVANVKGLDEVLCLSFSLLCLRLFIDLKNKWKYNTALASGACLLAALLSKETAVFLVVTLPVMAYLLRYKWNIRDYLPHIIAVGIYFVLRMGVAGVYPGTTASMELMNNPMLTWTGTEYIPMAKIDRVKLIGTGLGEYLRLLVAPIKLSHDYYPWYVDPKGVNSFLIAGSWLIYVLLTIMGVVLMRKRKIGALALIFILGPIFIVSNILFPVGTIISERFLYIPVLGYAMLLSGAAAKLDRSWIYGFLGILILLFSIKTSARNRVWKDNYTLFTTDVVTMPNSAKLSNAAGGVLLDKYKTLSEEERDIELVDKASVHLRRALQIHPSYANAQLLLANAAVMKGNFQEAINIYQQLLKRNIYTDDVKNNLSIAYQLAGKEAGEKNNDLLRSIAMLNKSLELDPTNIETLRLLGVAHGIRGETRKSMYYFEQVLEQNPRSIEVWRMLALAAGQAGETEKQEEALNRVRNLLPE